MEKENKQNFRHLLQWIAKHQSIYDTNHPAIKETWFYLMETYFCIPFNFENTAICCPRESKRLINHGCMLVDELNKSTYICSVKIQRIVRGFIIRKQQQGHQDHDAATRIQRIVRGFIRQKFALKLTQAYEQGFLIEYLFEDNRHNAAAIKIQSIARLFLHRSKPSPTPTGEPPASAVRDELILMMQQMEEDKENFNKIRETLTQEREARSAKWANFFHSYRTSTVISTEERQQRHHDQDAATRIQSIVRGFLQRKFQFDLLVQESAVIIQASLRGFLYRKQTHLKTQQDHLKDMNHLDDLIRNFTNDFNVITNEFRQLIESPRDDTQDHTIVRPRHGPDPVLPTQSGKQRWTTEIKENDDLHHGLFFLTFTRFLFDPGGKHFKINNAHDLQKKVVSFEQVDISNEGKFPLETTKTPTTAPTSLPSSTTPKIPSVFISFHAILALTLQFFTLTNKYKNKWICLYYFHTTLY